MLSSYQGWVPLDGELTAETASRNRLQQMNACNHAARGSAMNPLQLGIRDAFVKVRPGTRLDGDAWHTPVRQTLQQREINTDPKICHGLPESQAYEMQ